MNEPTHTFVGRPCRIEMLNPRRVKVMFTDGRSPTNWILSKREFQFGGRPITSNQAQGEGNEQKQEDHS